MRWWAGGCAIAAVVVLAGCGASTGRGAGAGAGTGASGSRSARPSGSPGVSEAPSGSASSGGTVAPSGAPSAPASRSPGGCVAGRADVSVAPGGPVRRRLCVRPGTVVALTLLPRLDDKRWTGVLSSAPALVVASDWRVHADGTAHATLRCAGTRGGTAQVTAAAKAPDIAGAARPVFTLDVDVVPYAQEG